MRIISGKHKGRHLMAPKNLPVRPTKDMAKEALFNILNNQFYFPDITVLDLFAGTGNISFEFASRGVEKITAVDSHSGCVHYIDQISAELQMGIHTVKNDVFSFLAQHGTAYDVIFADPFYDMPLTAFETLVSLVFENKLVKEDGLLIVEHAKQTSLDHLDHFNNARTYGGSVFSFFSNTI